MIEIRGGNDTYYIMIIRHDSKFDNLIGDCEIADYLDIPIIKYISLLERYGAHDHFPDHSDRCSYHFRNKDDCQRFVDEIVEPNLVMRKLVGE